MNKDCIMLLPLLVIIIIIMALQPFAGSWQLFQFLDPISNRLVPLDGGSARRKASAYTQNNTNSE
jgi:hypothetical protein